MEAGRRFEKKKAARHTRHWLTAFSLFCPLHPPAAGCESVSLSVQPGYDEVPGAAFMINITLNSKAGLLLPSGAQSVPAFFLGK